MRYSAVNVLNVSRKIGSQKAREVDTVFMHRQNTTSFKRGRKREEKLGAGIWVSDAIHRGRNMYKVHFRFVQSLLSRFREESMGC